MIRARPNDTSSVETLESRRLLSASVVNGTLYVVGTNAGDSIGFTVSPPYAVGFYVVSIRVALNNAPLEEFRFPVGSISSVSVRALAGDDTVRLDASSIAEEDDVPVPSRIDGGLGNDTLIGTPVRDVISGGFGNDLIVGKRGDDWLDGGWGRDDLRGGDGNDYLFGGYGDDTVYGEVGDDRLSGGPGNDQVGSPGYASDDSTPEPGNDLLLGGGGEDWMNGGSGTDRVFGNAGRDHFSPLDEEPAEIRDRAASEPRDVPTPSGQGYVTFAFRGTVTRVSTPMGPRGGIDQVNWPAPGTEFRGTYTFNPIAPGRGANSGAYTTSPNGPVRVEIGDFRWAGPGSFVTTYDVATGDTYEAGDWIPGLELVSNPELATFLDRWNFTLRIVGDATLLNGPALPMVPPSLEHATQRTLTLTGDNGFNTSPIPYVVIVATLDSLSLVPTVEG